MKFVTQSILLILVLLILVLLSGSPVVIGLGSPVTIPLRSSMNLPMVISILYLILKKSAQIFFYVNGYTYIYTVIVAAVAMRLKKN